MQREAGRRKGGTKGHGHREKKENVRYKYNCLCNNTKCKWIFIGQQFNQKTDHQTG